MRLSLLNLLVIMQVLTMIGLGLWFWHKGDVRLGLAQFIYCVATVVIFGGR